MRDVIPSKNCGLIVGNAAGIVSTMLAKGKYGINFESGKDTGPPENMNSSV